MKFFLRFFAFVAIIIAIIFGIFWVKVYGPGAGERLEKSLQATDIDKNKNAPAPAPQGTPVPRVTKALAIQQAATANGVTVVSHTVKGLTDEVVLTWIGDNNQKGGDFLDTLVRMGALVDFEESAPPQVTRNRRGQNEWKVQYRLQLN